MLRSALVFGLLCCCQAWLLPADRGLEPNVEELQRLEQALERAAVAELEVPKRVIREDVNEITGHRAKRQIGSPLSDKTSSVGKEAGKLPATEDGGKKRVAREKPKILTYRSPISIAESSKTWLDSSNQFLPYSDPYSPFKEKTHFHSGASVSHSLPPNAYPGPPAQALYPPPLTQYPPELPAKPYGCAKGGCSGTTVHIHDTHLPTQHVPQSYTATVPYVSGYRLTPVIGEKKITLNDWYHPPSGQPPCSACDPNQHIYGRQLMPEDVLSSFEAAQYFQMPESLMSHGLGSPEEYEHTMEDLQHQMEHVKSLRDNLQDTHKDTPPAQN